MERISSATVFIRANMPYGAGGTLANQNAWDVAAFVVSHPRPQDPRFTGSVTTTREISPQRQLLRPRDQWEIVGYARKFRRMITGTRLNSAGYNAGSSNALSARRNKNAPKREAFSIGAPGEITAGFSAVAPAPQKIPG